MKKRKSKSLYINIIFIIFSKYFYRIQLHAFNWTEDDSELIDFDNSSFNENKINIKSSCKIFRVEDDTQIEYISEDNDSSRYMKLSDNEENIKMGEIKYKKNKFYYMPIIQEELDDLNGEKCFSYLVLKGDKYPINKNKYKIKEGDIFKLARIYFIVRGLHIKKKKIEQKDTNCLISYHSKINQSLNINEDYNYNNYENNDENSSDSSDTDICEENENESDEKDKNDEIFKISKNKNKDKKKIPQIKSRKKKKNKDKNLIDELKSEKNINIKPKANDNHLNSNESKNAEKHKICRICYMGEIENNTNPLIKPCKCSGSMKYIHLKCLLHWLKTKIGVDKSEYIENNYFSIYSPENVQCELCKEYLPHYIKHNNKLFNLTELEQNFDSEIKGDNKNKDNKDKDTENNDNSDDNYVVLDSMSPDKEILPYRYITRFSKNKTLKIGRGLEMNLILNDLSISRNHCQLELSDNGDVFLKDNNSKFGTLILVQSKSIEILKGQTLTIQAGRTFFNIYYKSNFSLFGCCKPEEIDLKNTYERINSKSIKIDKNSVVLLESDSDVEGDPDRKGNNIINDEDKREENEYENNIKKINNKKIRIMKISKKDNKKSGNSDTNIKSLQHSNSNKDKEINIDKEDIKEGISISEQKRERSKSKKKSLILKSLDNEDVERDNNKDKHNNKNKSNKKKVNNKEEQINNDKKNKGKEDDK